MKGTSAEDEGGGEAGHSSLVVEDKYCTIVLYFIVHRPLLAFP